ncbi:SDR family NAD(P)-dependent oxidoreductase [Parapedobacter sp. 10938]|uniref:SDR family NAD(P)-dependent oxidoreductase n=1 Tax=Parapedobacter flavus TaxID=3110225 RepID=UPI002DBD7D3F|nr:SDR family oxidoreductase [Parapedobacter sp. 10938]MEC3879416.1 SDR family oxidoreductase [Parapedobacter sp. 10938]
MATIVITGASKGIGFETALALAQAGHRVVAVARSRDGLEKMQETARKQFPNASIHALVFDIIHGDYEKEFLPYVYETLGQVDTLINNAGVLVNKSFENTSIKDFSAMLEGNLLGHVGMIKHVLPLMPRNGHIVNIGSMGGFQGSAKFPGLAAYSASKAALHALTECLAMELEGQAIKINCLALGSAQTEMLANAFPQYQSPVTAQEMGAYIAQFALTGHRLFNGKILPVAVTTP